MEPKYSNENVNAKARSWGFPKREKGRKIVRREAVTSALTKKWDSVTPD